MTEQTPAQSVTDPATTALIERISAALGRTGPVLTPLQALLVDVRARLWEIGQPAADACAPGGIDLVQAAQAAVPHVMCHAFCDLQLQVGDCDCGAQKALANLTAALDSTDPFAALVEVARRAASSSGIGDETAPEIANRVAREYLAERGLR